MSKKREKDKKKFEKLNKKLSDEEAKLLKKISKEIEVNGNEKLKKLVQDANEDADINDASYVIAYNTAGGRVLLPGDAHNDTWDFVLEEYKSDLENVEFMLAPHHGRDSNRDWKFLDELKPKFSVFGCAPSRDLAYNAWRNRGLEYITQNQAGNIAIYFDIEGLNIYVENENFAANYPNADTNRKDKFGNVFLKKIPKA